MAENKKKIFIADDDEAVLTSLRKLLQKSGFDVVSVQDAQLVLSSLKTFKPDLILLDLLMPNLGGFEICELINNEKSLRGTPIIIISALRGYTDIKRAYQLGVIGYVTKPYDFTKLLDKINKALLYKDAKSFQEDE